MRVLIFLLLNGLFFLACGEKQDTKYGNAGEVSEYRNSLNPIIEEINAIELELRDKAVGSSGKASGENLANVCTEIDNRLVDVGNKLDELKPPEALLTCHTNIREAIASRRLACMHIKDGWKIERDGSFDEAAPMYSLAEEMMVSANLLLVLVQEVLISVDGELAAFYSARSPAA